MGLNFAGKILWSSTKLNPNFWTKVSPKFNIIMTQIWVKICGKRWSKLCWNLGQSLYWNLGTLAQIFIKSVPQYLTHTLFWNLCWFSSWDLGWFLYWNSWDWPTDRATPRSDSADFYISWFLFQSSLSKIDMLFFQVECDSLWTQNKLTKWVNLCFSNFR